jgi:N-acetylglucosaminyldiphosphoundecaprenol N-acetyl-beta-D-mannosaminyltransferase
MNEKLEILGLQINQISFDEAIEKVKILAVNHTPSYVCFANVHMVIEAYKDKAFANEVNNAALVLADGKPVAKACKLLYNQYQERIAGMDFMPLLLQSIGGKNIRIFFYGSDNNTLSALYQIIKKQYPGVQIAGAISPPFHTVSLEEQTGYIETINKTKPHIVFVCLGCPKQEKWMYEHHRKIDAVLLGVGGALRVMARVQKRAPAWMQKNSLEWLYRLKQEPKRLFQRYFITNNLFIYLLCKKLIKKKFHVQSNKR